MKILLSGGGTGGHITPILALAHELKRLKPECETVYVGERKGAFMELTDSSKDIDSQYGIFAGKLRRYHGESWLRRILDIKTILKNLRDMAYVALGFFQSLNILRKEKPDVVFLKGGFVGVPMGLAAALKHIPLVTHDSDAVPGLANRVVSRWASMHATALPAEYYDYPADKTKMVGVLVDRSYQPVDSRAQAAFKQKLGLPKTHKLLLVTGGSTGAARLNKAVLKILPDLLKKISDLQVIHQVGKGKRAVYKRYSHERLEVLEFLSPMHEYTGAADLIITRAGANSLAEFGIQGKACVVVPNPDLTSGHQIKNAELLEEQGAAAVVTEDKLYDLQQGLLAVTETLLHDEKKLKELGSKIQKATVTDASQRLAALLVKEAKD